jgi:hypothetical protein
VTTGISTKFTVGGGESLLTVFTYLIFMLLSNWLMGSLQVPREVQPPPTSAPTIDSASTLATSEGPQTPVK